MLHQPVVGPPGKGQGIQKQRVQAGQFQQSQARIHGLQVRNVEGYEIVAQDEPRSLGHAVQSAQLSSIRRSISSGGCSPVSGRQAARALMRAVLTSTSRSMDRHSFSTLGSGFLYRVCRRECSLYATSWFWPGAPVEEHSL